MGAGIQLQGTQGAATQPPYNLGSIGEELHPAWSNGPYQFGYLNGDVTIFAPDGGTRSKDFYLEFNYTNGAYTVTFSGIRIESSLAARMPVLVEEFKTYLIHLHHQGGGWTLQSFRGPFPESED